MANTMVAPTNKSVLFGGAKKKAPPAQVAQAVVPSSTAQASGAVKKARSMLKRGLISKDQHDQLAAKADKIMKLSPADDGM